MVGWRAGEAVREMEGVGGVELVGVGEVRDVTERRGEVIVVIERSIWSRRPRRHKLQHQTLNCGYFRYFITRLSILGLAGVTRSRQYLRKVPVPESCFLSRLSPNPLAISL